MMIDDDNDNGDDRVDAIDYYSITSSCTTASILVQSIFINQSIIYIGKITTYLYMDGLLSIMNGTCLWPFINTIVSENPDTAPTSTPKYVQRR